LIKTALLVQFTDSQPKSVPIKNSQIECPISAISLGAHDVKVPDGELIATRKLESEISETL
jgi:hypothetical protein